MSQLIKKSRTEIFGGAIRREGSNWQMIDDAGHDPIGIQSVSQPDSFTYRINYENQAGTVGTVISNTDFELAAYLPSTGANGGLNSATFCAYAPCRLFVNGRGSVTASPIWTSQVGLIEIPDATSVHITHPNRGLAVDPPVVTPIVPASGSLTRPFHVAWSATTTTITSLDFIQGYLSSNGSAFALNGCPNLGVGFFWSAGALTVTHPAAAGHANVKLTALNSPLRPEVGTITDTSFTIQFRGIDGALVGPDQTAQMSVLFERTALVPSTMDAGARFAVDLGSCRVANQDIGSIPLNNFWIMGVNNR